MLSPSHDLLPFSAVAKLHSLRRSYVDAFAMSRHDFWDILENFQASATSVKRTALWLIARYALINHKRRVRHEVSFVVTPKCNRTC